jgi:SAM-dependent methyltransferase
VDSGAAPTPIHAEENARLRAAVTFSRGIEWALARPELARAFYAAGNLRGRVGALTLRGDACECPCCGGHFRRMARRRLVGFSGLCPRCRSFSRQRAITLLLERGELPRGRVLHFAPEPLFDAVFARLAGYERVTADLFAPADLKLDITDMDLPDDSFDLILCSHVLEHVPDDAAAMRELHRVLAPGGVAVILNPYRPHQLTYEDPAVTEPLARMVHFGQHDHVRVYGRDETERLAAAGFEVRDVTAADLFDAATVERFELDPSEHLFLCGA